MSTGARIRTGSIQEESASASTGRRLPRIRFFSSIRFRLTAWYVFVLIIILTLLGVLLSTFLGQALENEVDNRLHNAQAQVGNPEIREENDVIRVDPGEVWLEQAEENPEFQSLVTSGLFFLVTNLQGTSDSRMGSVPDDLLSTLDLNRLTPDKMMLQTVTTNGQRVRVLMRPIVLRSASALGMGERVIAAVVVGESLERQENVLEVVNQLLRTAGAAGVLLATWGGWLLAGRALAPVNKITSTADEIARQGDAQESLSTRLEVNHTGDELARLAITFNAMLERIERAFRGQRRFVADASHELRTPLTAIQGNVDVLYRLARSGRQVQPADLQDALGDMKRESARMARLIDDLLLLARTDAEGLGHMIRPEPVSLDVVAREAFRTAESIAKGQRLHLTIRQPLMIYGDGDRLVQVMIILLDNALRHTPPGGTVDLIVDAAETDDGSLMCARIQVVDSGEGIPDEHLPHLFERFYRVEGSRSRLAGGSGLGLAIALAIVRGHNGWIEVSSPEGKGTYIAVWLPILESPDGDSEALPVMPLPHDESQDSDS
ncbi:MAG TPA: ATP-binding protein [Thermomicrobiales bacterium]|nr:ATP-binding protein [Thermomicrobiales bacterium]